MPVDDLASQRLNSCFYELLVRGHSKAEAMREAQLAILSEMRSAGRFNPASWLPYVLIGDPN
jgi:CHAT domain-containing protein